MGTAGALGKDAGRRTGLARRSAVSGNRSGGLAAAQADGGRAEAEHLQPAPQIDERLIEMNFGSWEGLRWNDVPRAELDAWAADVAGYAPPGGESPLTLQRRALDFVASLTVPEAVIVTHAGVIRTLLAHWQDLPPTAWPQLVFAYGSRTTVEVPR